MENWTKVVTLKQWLNKWWIGIGTGTQRLITQEIPLKTGRQFLHLPAKMEKMAKIQSKCG